MLEDSDVGFAIRRVYFLFDVHSHSERGSHAHKALTQLLVPISGSFSVDLVDSYGEKKEFVLNDPLKALLIPPGFWRTLAKFSAGAVCLVLADELYNENDYIRDYEEFKEWSRTSHSSH